jgi:hypothetical protein
VEKISRNYENFVQKSVLILTEFAEFQKFPKKFVKKIAKKVPKSVGKDEFEKKNFQKLPNSKKSENFANSGKKWGPKSDLFRKL